jgi:hypothetical protein
MTIYNIEFDTSPIAPGETRLLRVFSNSRVHVSVLCYFSNPPPPQYRPCVESKETWLNSGEAVEIKAAETSIYSVGKFLDVFIKDLTGDRRFFRLTVKDRFSGGQTSDELTLR